MPVPPEIARFLAALDKTQYLDADGMRAYQRRLLDRLLRHARTQVPYQAERLAPLFRADDSIDWDRWNEIPILTRMEAQELGDALKARGVPPAAGAMHRSTSSGSTGRAFVHYSNDLQRLASACANERFFTWHGLDPAALVSFIHSDHRPESAYPHGHHYTGWRIAHPDSPIATLAVSTPVHQQVEWLRRTAPDILWSYPTNLREIGRVMAEDGVPLHVDAVMTVGEMVSTDLRAEIERAFGHAPLDQYGLTEVGHVSGTCPHSGEHHIASDLVLVEIVDEHGNIVADGTEGRIVATPFYNYAMPFIRYDTGDLAVRAAEPCGCGRKLPLLERILGRSIDVFRFADGTRVAPMIPSVAMDRFVPHTQCQLAQTALDRIELRYVPRSADQTNDLAGLTDYLRRVLHPSLSVDITPIERIDRLPSGKFPEIVGLPDRYQSRSR